jgi:arylsulfatase A
VRILKAPRKKPLFLYVALTATHDPLQTTLAFAVQGVDRAVGQIAAAAKGHTLVVFAADNGRFANAPLRGGKYDIWEGGVRVPFIMRWTGRVPAGRRVATPVSLLDVAPTTMAAAGAPVPGDLDGLDLLGAVPADRAVFFGAFGRAGHAVRRNQWKLYEGYEGVPVQLYDVLGDKGETRNVAAGNAAVVQALAQTLNTWKVTVND